MFGKFRKAPAFSGPPEYIIAGLGNPGKKYEVTRHNAGFLCMDLLCDKLGAKTDRLKFKSLIGDVQIGGHRCLIMRPQTFMNSSGEAVREATDFYKIPPERVIVIFDDISLPCGKLRIRRKGSAGGHNGIKSIILHLNSDEFPRIKLGIGSPPHEDFEMIDYVLSNFRKDEFQPMREAMAHACDALEMIVAGDIDGAMGKFN